MICSNLLIYRNSNFLLRKIEVLISVLTNISGPPVRIKGQNEFWWQLLLFLSPPGLANFGMSIEPIQWSFPLGFFSPFDVQLLSCVLLCDPMDCSPLGLPVLHRPWPASSIRLWPPSGQGWVWWSPCFLQALLKAGVCYWEEFRC